MRTFPQNTVYSLGYTITTTTTTGNSSASVTQLNYTCLYVVEKSGSATNYFSGTCQKRSEQLFDENGVAEDEPIYFDNSTTFEQMLRTGEFPSENSSIGNDTNDTSGESENLTINETTTNNQTNEIQENGNETGFEPLSNETDYEPVTEASGFYSVPIYMPNFKF